jgi:hypothetical protein
MVLRNPTKDCKDPFETEDGERAASDVRRLDVVNTSGLSKRTRCDDLFNEVSQVETFDRRMNLFDSANTYTDRLTGVTPLNSIFWMADPRNGPSPARGHAAPGRTPVILR